MSRAVYDVAPIEGGWLIRMAGDSVSEVAPSKSEAIRRAQQLARRADEWSVRVLSRDGSLESEIDSQQPESRT